ncbi:MAG TPA: hypothetical protein VIQ51_06210, partial [Chryseosolibacter sp.]
NRNRFPENVLVILVVINQQYSHTVLFHKPINFYDRAGICKEFLYGRYRRGLRRDKACLLYRFVTMFAAGTKNFCSKP